MSKQAIILLDENCMTVGTVENLIEMTADSAIGFVLPLEKLLWDCGQYPVAIGDRWEDGVWSREGGALVPMPTAEERLAGVEDDNRVLKGQFTAQQENSKILENCLVEMASVVYA